MGESLTNLFGEDEASVADETLTEDQNDVRQRVQSTISAHENVFLGKPEEERQAATTEAERLGLQLATHRHHRVTCPACQCVATVQGRPFGKEHITHNEGDIIVRQAVAPMSFACSACGLKLEGYPQLESAGLGGHYQRKTTYSPDEYSHLPHP